MTLYDEPTSLQTQLPLNPPKLPGGQTVTLNTVALEAAASRFAAYVPPLTQKTVTFVLIETHAVFRVQVVDRILIGRRDFESNDRLDIDLMEHGGRAKGVSRCHAALYRNRYTFSIVDLNSTNGTFLNGVRMQPEQPNSLRDGDEVCLGRMLFHVHLAY